MLHMPQKTASHSWLDRAHIVPRVLQLSWRGADPSPTSRLNEREREGRPRGRSTECIVKSQILISCTWNSNPFLLAYEGINGNCIKGAIDERTKGSHYTIPIEIKHNVKPCFTEMDACA